MCAFYSTVFVLEFTYLVFLQPITSTLILIVTWLRLVGQKKKTLDRRKFTTERGRKIKFPSLSFFDSLDCFQRRDKLSTCTSWNMDSYQLHLHRNWREIWDICEWGVKKTRAHWQWNSFSGNIPSWMYEEKFGKKKFQKNYWPRNGCVFLQNFVQGYDWSKLNLPVDLERQKARVILNCIRLGEIFNRELKVIHDRTGFASAAWLVLKQAPGTNQM